MRHQGFEPLREPRSKTFMRGRNKVLQPGPETHRSSVCKSPFLFGSTRAMTQIASLSFPMQQTVQDACRRYWLSGWFQRSLR